MWIERFPSVEGAGDAQLSRDGRFQQLEMDFEIVTGRNVVMAEARFSQRLE